MTELPQDVVLLIHSIFEDCNLRVSRKLTNIPNLHETSLDLSFIEHFTHYCRPVKTSSDWMVRIDCHFIGGGRHYREKWEIADFGILVFFRHRGKVLRSKVALFQSKRLFPKEDPNNQIGEVGKILGFNYIFIDDTYWSLISRPRTFTFSDRSLYRELAIGDEQYEAIEDYEKQYRIPVHYMLYNPNQIPSSSSVPVTTPPDETSPCDVGCRIVPSRVMRQMVSQRSVECPPSYAEVSTRLPDPFSRSGTVGGWRLEKYVTEMLIACKDGLIDETSDYRQLRAIFSEKTRPISAAIAITIDMPASRSSP
jgi:hypothetical protein